MNSVETLLRPVAAMINRQVAAKTPARDLVRKLDHRCMALRVKDTALAVYLVVADNRIEMENDYEQDPDVVVSGSLLALAKLAGPGGELAIGHGDIDISGDVLIAQDFQKLLYFGKPDFEEELSSVVGDTAAHGIGEMLRGVAAWGRDARTIMGQNISEYLQEESRAVPTRDEVDGFRNKVNVLRDDVERLEARLGKINLRTDAPDVN